MEDHRANFLLSLLAYAVQRGLSPAHLCHLSGVDLAALKERRHSPISEQEVAKVWRNAVDISGDGLFGLHFGESLQLTALGVVGEIVKSSRTIGEAVTQAGMLVSMVTDTFTMEVAYNRQRFTLRFLPTGNAVSDPFHTRQMADFLMVFAIHELDGLVLEKIEPASVKLPFKVSQVIEYERVLRRRPAPRAGEYAVEFPGRFWSEPILTANYEMQRQLLQKVGASPAEPSLKASVSDRVTHYLTTNSYLGILSLEEVAANFNVSPRSLQRQLQAEGVAFKQLADAIRKSLAVHYLRGGQHRMKEISAMLGYNELSAFTRAFKRWTGKSPANFSDES